MYQKQSAKKAVEIATSLARKKAESTSISSAEKSLLRREAEGFIKLLQIDWNRCGRRSTTLKDKYPYLIYENIEVPSGMNQHSEGEGSSGLKDYQRKKSAGRTSLSYHKQGPRADNPVQSPI